MYRCDAISQYYWYQDFGFENIPVSILKKIGSAICDFWKMLRTEKIINFDECVMDVYVEGSFESEDDNFRVSLMDFNPSKPYLSSGSALFHWIYDFDVLSGQFSEVEFRLVGNSTV